MLLLLQNLLVIPAILALAVSGIKLYKSIMKDKTKENVKIEMLRHTVFSLIMLLVLIVSSCLLYTSNGYNTEKDIYKIVAIIVGEDNMLKKYFSEHVYEEKALNIFEEDMIAVSYTHLIIRTQKKSTTKDVDVDIKKGERDVPIYGGH